MLRTNRGQRSKYRSYSATEQNRERGYRRLGGEIAERSIVHFTKGNAIALGVLSKFRMGMYRVFEECSKQGSTARVPDMINMTVSFYQATTRRARTVTRIRALQWHHSTPHLPFVFSALLCVTV
jgi:hypothetical protein